MSASLYHFARYRATREPRDEAARSGSGGPAPDERHERSDGNHGAYDHRTGGKVEPQRREQAGGVAEHADGVGLEIAAVPLIKSREGRYDQRDENQKEADQLHRDGHRTSEEDIKPDSSEPLAQPKP